MKLKDIETQQFYVIEDTTKAARLERFLQGTNRIVKVIGRNALDPSMLEIDHYSYVVRYDRFKCWVPGVGVLAEFSNDKLVWTPPLKFAGYFPDHIYCMRSWSGVGFKYVRPATVTPPVQSLVQLETDRKMLLTAAKSTLRYLANTPEPKSDVNTDAEPAQESGDDRETAYKTLCERRRQLLEELRAVEGKLDYLYEGQYFKRI